MCNTKKKQKIAFVITKSNWGGAQRYVFDLVTNLNKDIFSPVVYTGNDGVLVAELKKRQIPVVILKELTNETSVNRIRKATKELIQIFKKDSPDIIHCNSSLAGIAGVLAGRRIKIPNIIFTAHGWAFNEDRSWLQKKIIKCIHWITVLLSHRTIAVSNSIKIQMNWLDAQRKISVIYPGRDTETLLSKPAAREILYAHNSLLGQKLNTNTLWIGCVSELHPTKRVTNLIIATEKIIKAGKKVCVVICGEGQERKLLEDMIVKKNLEDSIFLLGHVQNPLSVMQAFDIFCHPSQSEAYGYVIHEAGLASLPVIAHDVGGIPEIINHETSGLLIEKNNTDDLTKGLIRLLDSAIERIDFGVNLHQTVKDRTVQKMVSETTNLYK